MHGPHSPSGTPHQPHAPNEWLEISVRTDPVAFDALSSLLFDIGCTGIVTEGEADPFLKAYLPFSEHTEEIRQEITRFLRTLQEVFALHQSPTVRFRTIADQAWHVVWRRFFRPVQVTPHLLILPQWEPVPDNVSGHVIRMDPGPAFGTGYHETTRMCLQAMEKVSGTPPWTMLDVGTGSGILALYAALRGAERILGIDIDPEALRWAKRNVRLNGLSAAVELASIPVEGLTGQFSVVCANLMLEEIKRLFPVLSERTAPEGWMILSGILGDQVAGVSSLVDRSDTRCQEITHEGEWTCFRIRKRGQKA